MKPPSARIPYQGSLNPPWAPGASKKVPAGGAVKLRALRTFVLLGLLLGGFCAAAGLVLVGEEGLLVGVLVMGLFLLLGGTVAFTLQGAAPVLGGEHPPRSREARASAASQVIVDRPGSDCIAFPARSSPCPQLERRFGRPP
jgi:hypothetical protein